VRVVADRADQVNLHRSTERLRGQPPVEAAEADVCESRRYRTLPSKIQSGTVTTRSNVSQHPSESQPSPS